MYGRGRGLAEEAGHELELAHWNDPEFGNASAQGWADLFPARLCFRVGLGVNPRTLGGAAVRSHNGPAHRSHYHADRDGCLITVADETLQRASNSRLNDPNGSGGVRSTDTRRDRGCRMGARVIPSGNILRAS